MGWKDSLKKVGMTVATGGLNLVAEQRAQKKIVETGVPARAVCREFEQQWDPSEGSSRWGYSQMTLEVQPEGGAPYEWSGSIWVRVEVYDALPGDIEGMSLPVKVDPADPQKVAVDWEALASEVPADGG